MGAPAANEHGWFNRSVAVQETPTELATLAMVFQHSPKGYPLRAQASFAQAKAKMEKICAAQPRPDTLLI